jgi:HAD superfamily hydrolase (TIGR01509 family)
MRRKLDGVLLDVDGTLVDSNDAHARAWSEALSEFGHRVPATEIRPLIGMGGDKLLPTMGVDPESTVGKAVADRRGAIFLERYVPQLRPTRGAKELVARLKLEGLDLVIATSAREEELEAMLRQVGLDDLVKKRTSADDAENSKPDPDIVHAALERAKLSPTGALLLGDTPYDVEAASQAQVKTVALLCGGWDADALSGAIAIYEDPADLLRHFTSSPFASAA